MAYLIRVVEPYGNRYNCLAAWLPSLENGVDNPDTGEIYDTALDSYVEFSGNEDVGEIYYRVDAKPFAEKVLGRKFLQNTDYYIPLVNTEYGATDGMALSLVTASDPYDSLLHEMGHDLFNLYDEYLALLKGRVDQIRFLKSRNGKIRGPNLAGDHLYAWEENAL